MSIERSQSSSASEQARDADPGRRSEPSREPAPRERVDRFEQVLHSKQEARDEFLAARRQGAGQLHGGQRAQAQSETHHDGLDHVVEAGRRGSREAFDNGGQQARMEPAEILAMMQVQSALREAAHAPVPLPAGSPAAFADLLERHVRQLAASEARGPQGDGQVLLRMADSTLPGTDLLLSKTADGWLLRADVRSRDSYDAITQAAPELARRFAEKNLGTLEVEQQFNG